MSSVTDVLDYYEGLLIRQYRSKSRARQTIRLLTNQSLAEGVVFSEQVCFELDTAIGAQLDILGRIVGVNRNVYGLDLSHTFFNFTTYAAGASNGFQNYGVPVYPDGVLWDRYDIQGNAVYRMSDGELRSIIKMKILKNNSRSSLKNVAEGMWAIFGPLVQVVENPNTHILAFSVDDTLTTTFAIADYLKLLPNPAGIGLTLSYVTDIQQLLTNGDQETWTGLTDLLTNGNMESGSPPSSWSLVGADASWARESTTIKEGTYSGKLTRAGTNCYVVQNVTVSANTTTYVASGWVYQTAGAANRASIVIAFSGGNNSQAFHSGVATGWEFLTVVCANTNRTTMSVRLDLDNTDGYAYADSFKCYAMLAPTGFTFSGAGATVAREEGTVHGDTYSAKLTRNGTNLVMYQDFTSYFGGIAGARGRTFMASARVWASVADRAYLTLSHSQVDGNEWSLPHPGDSAWHYLTVISTLESSVNEGRVNLRVIMGDTTTYFDDTRVVQIS